LVVLDALLDEAHVSRAADRLGLSQPAASSALERCRHLFRDPLLERGRGIMRLTPKAEALRVPLKNLLAQVKTILDLPPVALKELRQTVRIVMTDHPASIIVGPLHARLAKTAPGIDLVVCPGMAPRPRLRTSPEGEPIWLSRSFRLSMPRFDARSCCGSYVVVMRKSQPAARRFGLAQWLSYPHLDRDFLANGELLMWEYPRLTPTGSQVDLVESMELKRG
jgi:DNA-binding transcriptional LysR family regulator